MKIKTRTILLFKVRRLTDHTQLTIPFVYQKVSEQIKTRWNLLQKDKLEREIFNSCVILKNLAIVYREMPMSADFILEQLMESSQGLHHVYADILAAYRSGEGEDAFKLFSQRVPLKTAQKFAHILGRIEDINPAELIAQMDAFKDILSAERKTKGMARAETKSLITTLAATSTIFSVLLNFTTVVVFLDTLQILENLF